MRELNAEELPPRQRRILHGFSAVALILAVASAILVINVSYKIISGIPDAYPRQHLGLILSGLTGMFLALSGVGSGSRGERWRQTAFKCSLVTLSVSIYLMVRQ